MPTQRRISFPFLLGGLLLLVALGAIALLLARGPLGAPPPEGNLVGADVGGAFALVDGDGKTVTDKDFSGRYRLMYFGYSFCPDVCPTDVQRMMQGFAAFEKADPARAAKVAPIFVSVDPERDTPAVVKQFAAAFHPRLVGLTGSRAQIDAAKKTFRVYAAKRGEGENYLMDHSAMVYLFGPDGAPIAFVAQPTPQEVAAELDRFVT
jgi:protein SCO1/2